MLQLAKTAALGLLSFTAPNFQTWNDTNATEDLCSLVRNKLTVQSSMRSQSPIFQVGQQNNSFANQHYGCAYYKKSEQNVTFFCLVVSKPTPPSSTSLQNLASIGKTNFLVNFYCQPYNN